MAFNIHRGSLLRSIGFPGGKIPANFAGLFPAVQCVDRWTCYREPLYHPFNVVVLASNSGGRGGWKSSSHRVYVECPQCSRYIPAGRFHQHEGTKACRQYQEKVGA